MHCMGMEMLSQTRALAPSMGTDTFSHAAVVCEPGSFPIANFADLAMGCSSPATRLELAPRCSASHVTGATGDACGRNLRSRTAGESALSSPSGSMPAKKVEILLSSRLLLRGAFAVVSPAGHADKGRDSFDAIPNILIFGPHWAEKVEFLWCSIPLRPKPFG